MILDINYIIEKGWVKLGEVILNLVKNNLT